MKSTISAQRPSTNSPKRPERKPEIKPIEVVEVVEAPAAEQESFIDRMHPAEEKKVAGLMVQADRIKEQQDREALALKKANAPELRRLTVMLEKNVHRNFKVSCLDIELDMREAVSQFVAKFLEERAKHPTRTNIMDSLTFGDF